MALVAPLLCAIMLGSVELGSFFYNEHILTKAVRDGARYAARRSFSFYESGGNCANPTDATLIANVRALVRTSLLSAGTDRFPDIQDSDITVTAACSATVSGQSMSGIYQGRTGGTAGAPVVTVTASIDYNPVIGAFGFTGAGLKLNARQQAAVMGI
ncbi:pilus assembly protein [Sphingomonas sp. NSE70-1]|uniref:Pilus assembly protein n=2 Tax=Sphingomonas caseinilyticus TaxID=2908205 RepID=A0ABT0RW40_9SPHN|nr:pilus assembly protein [Sphingomonas caseinilyticus]